LGKYRWKVGEVGKVRNPDSYRDQKSERWKIESSNLVWQEWHRFKIPDQNAYYTGASKL